MNVEPIAPGAFPSEDGLVWAVERALARGDTVMLGTTSTEPVKSAWDVRVWYRRYWAGHPDQKGGVVGPVHRR